MAKKTALTIAKQLEREKYNNTPVGQAEKKIKHIHDRLILEKVKVPEKVLKQVDAIRNENEQKHLEFNKQYAEEVKKLNDKYADLTDGMLLDLFNKEIALLEPLIKNTTNNE